MEDLRAEADVVLIGAGHNGLIAAAYLLRAGWGVCLIDRMAHPGGWVRTQGPGAPGCLHDRWSALHPALVSGPVGAEPGPVRRHGLEYVMAPPATGSSLPDRRTTIAPVEAEALAAELGRLGESAGWDALVCRSLPPSPVRPARRRSGRPGRAGRVRRAGQHERDQRGAVRASPDGQRAGAGAGPLQGRGEALPGAAVAAAPGCGPRGPRERPVDGGGPGGLRDRQPRAGGRIRSARRAATAFVTESGGSIHLRARVPCAPRETGRRPTTAEFQECT